MKIEDKYQDYIRLRLNGENVISRAECDGIAVTNSIENDCVFYILDISQYYYSYYIIRKHSKRIMIMDFKENQKHDLKIVFTDNLMKDDVKNKWKSHIPSQTDNPYKLLYDASLSDDYSIDPSNESGKSFRELFEQIKLKVRNMTGPVENKSEVYLKHCFYSDCWPLLYILQEIFGGVKPMPQYDDNDIDCKGMFDFPDIKFNISESAPLTLMQMFGRKQMIHIPMDKTLKTDFVVNGNSNDRVLLKTWNDILPNRNVDYTVGDIDVKLLSPLFFEVDGYQNVFVTVRDARKIPKKLLLYTAFSSYGMENQTEYDDMMQIQSQVKYPLADPNVFKGRTVFKDGKTTVKTNETNCNNSPSLMEANKMHLSGSPCRSFSNRPEYVVLDKKIYLMENKEKVWKSSTNELLNKKKEIEDTLSFDTCYTDTNIWIRKNFVDEKMRYENLLYYLSNILYRSNGKHIVLGLVYDEIDKKATKGSDEGLIKRAKHAKSLIDEWLGLGRLFTLGFTSTNEVLCLSGEAAFNKADQVIIEQFLSDSMGGKRSLLITEDRAAKTRALAMYNEKKDEKNSAINKKSLVRNGEELYYLLQLYGWIVKCLKERKSNGTYK